MTISEAARYFPAAPRTIRRWIEDGKIRGHEVGVPPTTHWVVDVESVDPAALLDLRRKHEAGRVPTAHRDPEKRLREEVRDLREMRAEVLRIIEQTREDPSLTALIATNRRLRRIHDEISERLRGAGPPS